MVREATNNHGAGKKPPVIFFECDTLKADKEAEDHVMRFLPSLVGCDAVGTHAVPLSFILQISKRGMVSQ